ncbi:hypothetical protein GCM10028808_34030 [Spirosoma migulaei]
MNLKKIIDRIGYFPIAFFSLSIIGVMYYFTHREYLDKSEYYELTRQLTPDKKYYIYKYARYGAAFTGDITGYRLLERGERFAENAGKSFPYGFDAWLSKDTILVNRFDQAGADADTAPSRIDYKSLGNFTVKQVFYKSTVNGGGHSEYTCDSLYVSGGKLIILGIHDSDVKSMAFPLGPITIHSHAGIVSKLVVNGIRKYYDAANEPMITSESYEFIPYRSVSIKELGETGYYLSLL